MKRRQTKDRKGEYTYEENLKRAAIGENHAGRGHTAHFKKLVRYFVRTSTGV